MEVPNVRRSVMCLLASLSAACGNNSPCLSGASMQCSCEGGTQGVRLCQSDGAYGACSCGTLGNDGGVMGDPGGPVFLSFGSNVNSLTEGQTVRFTAVLTDPDGVDDLIGGALRSPDGAYYGAFATAAQEGSYSLLLSWAEISQARPIDFMAEQGRDFEAEFFDAGGRRAVRTLSLKLHCSGKVACDGKCGVALGSSADNCGACGNRCGHGGGCFLGECHRLGACVTSSAARPDETCTRICSAAGLACSNKCVFTGGQPATRIKYINSDPAGGAADCAAESAQAWRDGYCDAVLWEGFTYTYRCCCGPK